MPTAIKFGIDVFTAGDYIDKVGISRAIELAKRRGTSGAFVKGKAFNPTNEVNINGGGSSGLAIGIISPTISGLSGGVMYNTKDENAQNNSDFDDFTSSVEHMPGATNAT